MQARRGSRISPSNVVAAAKPKRSRPRPQLRKSRRQQAVQTRVASRITAVSRSLPTHGASLSANGSDYVGCAMNPRDGPLAHLPWGFPVRSRLVRLKITGTSTSGAGGVPFVAFNPMRMAVNNEIAALYSSNAYITGVGSSFLEGNTGVVAAYSNSDYDSSAMNSSTMTFRVVSAGLYVTASSSLTSRAGSLVTFCEPDHQSLCSYTNAAQIAPTVTQIMAYEGCRVSSVPMDNTEQIVLWGTPETAVEADWFDYQGFQNEAAILTAAAGATGLGLNNATMTTYLSAQKAYIPWYSMPIVAFMPDASQTTFRWEAYCVVEISGKTVVGKTVAGIDPTAYNTVAAAVSAHGTSGYSGLSAVSTALKTGLQIASVGIPAYQALSPFLKGAAATMSALGRF